MPKQTEQKPAAAKYEWHKTEKAFYLPKEKGPHRIDVPFDFIPGKSVRTQK